LDVVELSPLSFSVNVRSAAVVAVCVPAAH
jgi:hypothetical protein